MAIGTGDAFRSHVASGRTSIVHRKGSFLKIDSKDKALTWRHMCAAPLAECRGSGPGCACQKLCRSKAVGMRCREKEGERNKVRRLFKACNYVCIKGEEQRRALQSCGRDESLPWLFLIHANKVQYKKQPNS